MKFLKFSHRKISHSHSQIYINFSVNMFISKCLQVIVTNRTKQSKHTKVSFLTIDLKTKLWHQSLTSDKSQWWHHWGIPLPLDRTDLHWWLGCPQGQGVEGMLLIWNWQHLFNGFQWITRREWSSDFEKIHIAA